MDSRECARCEMRKHKDLFGRTSKRQVKNVCLECEVEAAAANGWIDGESVGMEHLLSILEAAGMTFKHVVKGTIYLDDMNNFGEVNQLYGTYFDNDTAPARETVAVKTLPKSVRIEISMIAIKD